MYGSLCRMEEPKEEWKNWVSLLHQLELRCKELSQRHVCFCSAMFTLLSFSPICNSCITEHEVWVTSSYTHSACISLNCHEELKNNNKKDRNKRCWRYDLLMSNLLQSFSEFTLHFGYMHLCFCGYVHMFKIKIKKPEYLFHWNLETFNCYL